MTIHIRLSLTLSCFFRTLPLLVMIIQQDVSVLPVLSSTTFHYGSHRCCPWLWYSGTRFLSLPPPTSSILPVTLMFRCSLPLSATTNVVDIVCDFDIQVLAFSVCHYWYYRGYLWLWCSGVLVVLFLSPVLLTKLGVVYWQYPNPALAYPFMTDRSHERLPRKTGIKR